ncbi:MAG: hypothetical protein AAGG46_13285 [Planctomycetota bacterium]
MKPCDLHTGQARIRRSLDDLLLAWQDASDDWNDPASRAFAEERLEPILPVVKTTLDVVGQMQNLLDQAMRDVEG